MKSSTATLAAARTHDVSLHLVGYIRVSQSDADDRAEQLGASTLPAILSGGR